MAGAAAVLDGTLGWTGGAEGEPERKAITTRAMAIAIAPI
jgi:hypothetical protein